MGTGVLWMWLITWGFVTGQEKHYMGGSISFMWATSQSGELTIVTEWTVGEGPCGLTCGEQHIGKDTKTSRKEMTTAHGVNYFGKLEIRGLSNLDDRVVHLIGYMADVDQNSGWEQEVSQYSFYIGSKNKTVTVRLRDLFWRLFDYNFADKADLQVEFNQAKRNDTELPNNSPFVMFNPLYRVQLNKVTKIYLATADPDDDIVRCGLIEGVQNMKMVTVSEDCSVTVEANERDGFRDQGYGIVNLVVSDFNRHALTLAGEERDEGDNRPLSTVPLQFMIQTVELTDAPVPSFVPPTNENQHVFIVYFGAVLEIPLYAKLSAVGKTNTFHAKSLPHHRIFVGSPHTERMHGDNITHSTLSWTPARGVYLLNVTVRNDKGHEGQERSYKVVVKDSQIAVPTANSKKTVNIKYYPKPGSIVCLQHATCTFFVLVFYDPTGPKSISHVNISSTTLPWVQASKPFAHPLPSAETNYQCDISFTACMVGEDNMCLIAVGDDGTTSDEVCVDVVIKPSDARPQQNRRSIYHCSCCGLCGRSVGWWSSRLVWPVCRLVEFSSCVAGLSAVGVLIFLIKRFCCPCSKINKVRTDLVESLEQSEEEESVERKPRRPSPQETDDYSGVAQ